MRQLRRRVGFGVLALGLATAALPAQAHDAPHVYGVLARGEQAALFLTNRGLIFAEPNAGRYRLLCNEALGFTTTEEPNAAFVPDGSLLIATSAGLLRTQDEGCTVSRVEPFAATNAPALAQDPADAARVYLATYDAASGGIYVSSDGGASFTRTHQAPETQFLEELVVAPSDPTVIYASGFDFSLSGPEREQVVLRSTDRGASFERIVVPLAANESDLTLLAVSPTDPDILLARALDDDAASRLDRLLVSRDGGRSWEAALTVHQLFTAGFTAGAVWATGIDGLYRSQDNAQLFVPVPGPTNMAGIAELFGDSLVCGRFTTGHNGIASVTAGSSALTAWFEFTEVTEAVACEVGTETQYVCESLWRDWQNEILFGAGDAGVDDAGVDDAGVEDAAVDADVVPVGSSSRGGGCSATAFGTKANTLSSTHPAWATWVLALLAYAFRRRR